MQNSYCDHRNFDCVNQSLYRSENKLYSKCVTLTNFRYVYPKEALPEQKEEIAKILGKTKERIPELKDALGLVREMSEKLADCKMTIAEEIKRNANERVLALREAEEKLLGRLEIIYTGKQKVLGLQRDGLELELGKISGCCEFAENVLKYENEVEILTIKNKLKNLSDIEVCYNLLIYL
jgi:hypothetical protein